MSESSVDEPFQWGFAVITMVLALGVSLGLVEVLAQSRDLPRVQSVDLDLVNGSVHNGVPIWESQQPGDDRRGEPCAGRPEVLLLGSSIFFGSGVPAEESLTPALQARLPQWCVRNLARPGYTWFNQAVELERHLAGLDRPPALVVWELWANSPNRWTVQNGWAYNFGSLSEDGTGVPNPFSLATGLHLALFDSLALYRQLVVRRAVPSARVSWEERFRQLGEQEFSPVVDGLRSGGSRVLLAQLPALDAPFSETARDPTYRYEPVVSAVLDRVTVVSVAEGLARRSLDHEAVRVDPCCHYNSAGLVAVAEVLSEAIEAMEPLDGGEAEGAGAASGAAVPVAAHPSDAGANH